MQWEYIGCWEVNRQYLQQLGLHYQRTLDKGECERRSGGGGNVMESTLLPKKDLKVGYQSATLCPRKVYITSCHAIVMLIVTSLS